MPNIKITTYELLLTNAEASDFLTGLQHIKRTCDLDELSNVSELLIKLDKILVDELLAEKSNINIELNYTDVKRLVWLLDILVRKLSKEGVFMADLYHNAFSLYNIVRDISLKR